MAVTSVMFSNHSGNDVRVNWTLNAATASSPGCSTRRYYKIERKRGGGDYGIVWTGDSLTNITHYDATGVNAVHTGGVWTYRVSSWDVHAESEGGGPCVPQGESNSNSVEASHDYGGLDVTPDGTINFGSQTVAVSTLAYSNTVTFSGISNGISAQVVNGEMSINGGGWTSAAGVINNGDTVQLRGTSPSLDGLTNVVSFTLGNANYWQFPISTALVTQRVQLQSSGAISMKDLAEVFGPDPTSFVLDYYGGPAVGLASYYRNGGRVDDHAHNANVPTSGITSLWHFFGASAPFGFVVIPNRYVLTQYPAQPQASWNINDYRYGTPIVEMRAEIAHTGSSGNYAGKSVVFTADSGWTRNPYAATIYSTWNGTQQDAEFWGTVTISIRPIRNPSLVISRTAEWRLEMISFL